MANPKSFEQAVDQLAASTAPLREQAARYLAEHPDQRAGPALVAALERELAGRPAWRARGWIATALGATRYAPALDALWRAAYYDADGAGVTTAAIGYALVAIEAGERGDADRAFGEFLDHRDLFLIGGGLEAVVTYSLRVGHDTQHRLLAVATDGRRNIHVDKLWRTMLLLSLVAARTVEPSIAASADARLEALRPPPGYGRRSWDADVERARAGAPSSYKACLVR